MAKGIQWDDEESDARPGIQWDAPEAPHLDAEVERPSEDFFSTNTLKRGANALIRAESAPLGPLAALAPQFDVAPMEAESDAGVFGRGVQQGASLGFADEDAGVRGAVQNVVYGDAPISDAVRQYVMARNAERGADKRAEEKNKAAFVGGDIAGSLLVPIPGGGAAAGASRLARFADAAKVGAGLGAAGGLGRSEADLTEGDVGGAMVDTSVGGLAGAAGGAIGEGLIQGAQKVATPIIQKGAQAAKDWLEETAAMRALKAAGYIGKDLKAQFRRDAQPLIDRGQALIDEGVVSPLASKATVAERAAEAQQKYGEAIGKVLETADSTGEKFNFKPFVDRARQEILAPMLNDPAVAPQAAQLESLLNDYASLPMGSVGFQRANQMKGNLQETINWGNQWNDAKANIPNDLKMKLQRIFLDEVDNQLGGVFEKQGLPGQKIRDVFKEIKARYGHMTDAADKARMGQARELGNSPVSLSDYLAGIGGAAASVASGNVAPLVLAAGGAVVNKLARERGSSTAASLASKLSQSQMLEQLIATNPQALGKWAAPLLNAAASGSDRLAATHFVLSQRDPEYRDHMKNLPALADSEAN